MAETPPTPDLETTAAPTPPEYRLPDDPSLSEALRGKSASELAAYIEMLEAAVNGNGHSAAAAPAPTPPPAAPAAPPSNGGYASATELQQLAVQQAGVTFTLAQQQHGDAFKRWGPEIAEVLQRVPQSQWTLDAITSAVHLVQGRHLDQIVAEKVRAVETTPSMMRPTGRNGSSYAPPKPAGVAERAFANWQQRATAAGITEREVREFCRDQDMTPDEFFAQFGDGLFTDAVADISNGKKRG